MTGFPADDEFSIQCGTDSGCNLDDYYTYQFMQNEMVLADTFDKRTTFKLSKHHIAYDFTGTIYLQGVPKFVFTANPPDYKFRFQVVGTGGGTWIKDTTFDPETGQFCFEWNEYPSGCWCIASYEYDMKANS